MTPFLMKVLPDMIVIDVIRTLCSIDSQQAWISSADTICIDVMQTFPPNDWIHGE